MRFSANRMTMVMQQVQKVATAALGIVGAVKQESGIIKSSSSLKSGLSAKQ